MKNKINSLLSEIYDDYKSKVEEASSFWKSDYCNSQKESEQRDIEDEEDLKYFKWLLQQIKEIYNKKEVR